MLSRKKAFVSAILALAAVVAVVLTAGASSTDGSLHATLAPSVPSDPAFHGVAAGGLPWVLKHGRVSISPQGEFDVQISGLVIPALGTPGPVKTVSAALYCGADSNTSAAAQTKSVPISGSGQAEINDHVMLPSSCLAPIVLIHPNNISSIYISVSGWRS